MIHLNIYYQSCNAYKSQYIKNKIAMICKGEKYVETCYL